MDALFDEVEELRMQVGEKPLKHMALTYLKLFESEMRCALIEADTREEVMVEMEERMRKMQELHARRLRQEVSITGYLIVRH